MIVIVNGSKVELLATKILGRSYCPGGFLKDRGSHFFIQTDSTQTLLPLRKPTFEHVGRTLKVLRSLRDVLVVAQNGVIPNEQATGIDRGVRSLVRTTPSTKSFLR